MNTVESAGPETRCHYWAFISYSHRDEGWARWLHHALETYRIPNRLAQRPSATGMPPGDRIYPVFLDRDELSGGFDLGERLKTALEQSRFLIVICSPHAVASRHVQQEIEVFEGFGREHRVLCLIVDGEPGASSRPDSGLQECLPVPVRTRRAPDGELVPCEPIAADVRKAKDGRTNAKLKILAEMLGVPFDELKERDGRRRLRLRLQMAAGAVCVSVVLGMAYLLALDAGVNAPGETTVRRMADRYGVSVLRRLPPQDAVHQRARFLRSQLADRLFSTRKDGWFAVSFEPIAGSGESVWSHSQTVFALLSVPDGEAKGRPDIASSLAKPFSSRLKFERHGIKYGWLTGADEDIPHSLPAFWTAMSLAAAIGKDAYPSPGARAEAVAHLTYVQDALAPYQPSGTAGWNLFPNQRSPAEHNLYAATLALMALLETKRANMPWRGSVDQRDRLLRQTFDWLVGQFDPDAHPPGWKAGGESSNATSEGLTLQLFGRLLEARAEAGLAIPPGILRAMPRHIAGIAGRSYDFPSANGEFSSTIAFEADKPKVSRDSITFKWYPWALDSAVRWLRSEEGRAAPVEEQVAVERALAHLVLTLGDEAVVESLKGWTFVAAETLYGLSLVAPPDGHMERAAHATVRR